MKILVLAENYTNLDGVVALHYIHTRNVIYKQQGHEVHVLSFRSNNSYVYEGIKVICEKEIINENLSTYDIVLSHAPNLKNHYRFIKKNSESIKKLVLFFHGHEVMDTVKLYPKEYSFININPFKTFSRKLYDIFKILVWRFYIRNNENINLVFVSEWMLDMFLDQTKLKVENIKSYKVIPNSIGQTFEDSRLDCAIEKEYDVITIRNNIDGSKYCIDLVVKMAMANPNLRFAVVGLGKYFEYFSKPDNLVHIKKNLSHLEVIDYLNKARLCYLPTRLDAQGVMACEIATLGMPLLTSDLPICREMMKEFSNVDYIDNDNSGIDISDILNSPFTIVSNTIVSKFYSSNTVLREIEYFEDIIEEKDQDYA